MFNHKYTPFVVVATILMTVQPIMVSLTKVQGKYEYLQVSTTLLSEILKFIISLGLYARLPPASSSHRRVTCGQIMRFSVPAFIYFVNNNFVFTILSHIDSATFQILSSLKIVFTGILFRLILHRKLSDIQWIAILLLACGSATLQLDGAADCSKQAGTENSARWIGVSGTCATCLLSSLGGIYMESLMKYDPMHHSIHMQNLLMYSWGIAMNLIALLSSSADALSSGGLLQGYRPLVWALVLNNALNGLAVSAILKYTDNIVRVFAHTAALILTIWLEVLFFSTSTQPNVFVAAIVVASSIYLYYQGGADHGCHAVTSAQHHRSELKTALP